MRAARKKTIVLLTCLVSLSLLSGCTNWEKKYQALLVEHENLKGQLEYERGEKGTLAARISQDQQTIEELQRQIDEQRKTPADATGFGEGYDVAFDPSAGTITVTLPNAILFDSGNRPPGRSPSRFPMRSSLIREKRLSRRPRVESWTISAPCCGRNTAANKWMSSAIPIRIRSGKPKTNGRITGIFPPNVP